MTHNIKQWGLGAESKSVIEFSSGPLNSDTQMYPLEKSVPSSANVNC